jgi:hypothetical protein
MNSAIRALATSLLALASVAAHAHVDERTVYGVEAIVLIQIVLVTFGVFSQHRKIPMFMRAAMMIASAILGWGLYLFGPFEMLITRIRLSDAFAVTLAAVALLGPPAIALFGLRYKGQRRRR